MNVVRIDAHRRIYVPKGIAVDGERVMIIPQGAAFLVIPVPVEPVEIEVKGDTRTLKLKADVKARADALRRTSRRRR